MPDFYRTGISSDSLIRGPGRLVIAGATVPFPAGIGDIVNLTAAMTSRGALYDANVTGGWVDLGSTKTGVNLERNNTEETLDVDQILGDIAVLPGDWEASIGTQLADTTLEHLALAWEGVLVAEATSIDGPRWRMGVGAPIRYRERKIAMLHQKDNGLIRAFVARRVIRAAQASAITFNKGGEQISIPIRFRCVPDTSIANEDDRLLVAWDQVGNPTLATPIAF